MGIIFLSTVVIRDIMSVLNERKRFNAKIFCEAGSGSGRADHHYRK